MGSCTIFGNVPFGDNTPTIRSMSAFSCLHPPAHAIIFLLAESVDQCASLTYELSNPHISIRALTSEGDRDASKEL